MYVRDNYLGDNMATLSLFLMDGLETEKYVDLLQDLCEKEGYFNFSWLKKQGRMVTIYINQDIFPNILPFTISINNLTLILQKLQQLERSSIDKITLSYQDDEVLFTYD